MPVRLSRAARRIKEISNDFNLVSSIVSDASRSSKEEIEILRKRKQIQEKKLEPLKQNIANWLELIGNGTAKRTNTTEVILKRMSEATQQEKQIEGEITEIDFQIKEVKNKVLNAEVMKDSLVRFSNLFERGDKRACGCACRRGDQAHQPVRLCNG